MDLSKEAAVVSFHILWLQMQHTTNKFRSYQVTLMVENADKYHLDLNNVFAIEIAGANLCGVIKYTYDDELQTI